MMRYRNSGFTLIELSVVLVIIGLLAGGILIGRDLIKAAEIRSVITQFEQFNTAVYTFKNKYDCLPGDCLDADLLGFDASSAGDGNDIIGPCNILGACANDASEFREQIDFWYMLGQAELIPHQFPPYATVASETWALMAGRTSPRVKITSHYPGAIGGWGVFANMPFYKIISFTNGPTLSASHNLTLAVQSGSLGGIGCYMPSDVFILDQKMDDGLPLSGKAKAWTLPVGSPHGYFYEFTLTFGFGPKGGPFCVDSSASPDQYNITLEDTKFTGVGKLCGLAIKASF